MVLVGTVILPHGTAPFDGDPNSHSDACRERHTELPLDLRHKLQELYQGTCKAGSEIAELNPDLIILLTPHGINLPRITDDGEKAMGVNVGVYLNTDAEGSALWNGHYDEFKVKVNLDKDKALALIDHLRHADLHTEGILCYSGLSCPLRWGEAVPIWYLQKYMNNPSTKYLIMTLSNRLESSVDNILKLGRCMTEFVASLSERTVVAISGDLSHAYETDCKIELYLPDPRSDLPIANDSALAMEKAMVQWCQSYHPNSEERVWESSLALTHLEEAIRINPTAYSCGMSGFITLHGLMSCHDKSFICHYHVCHAPTYFGMLAAVFIVN